MSLLYCLFDLTYLLRRKIFGASSDEDSKGGKYNCVKKGEMSLVERMKLAGQKESAREAKKAEEAAKAAEEAQAEKASEANSGTDQ